MEGPGCPRCGCGRMVDLSSRSDDNTHIIDTTNEWHYYCPRCDDRFNSQGQFLKDLVRP